MRQTENKFCSGCKQFLPVDRFGSKTKVSGNGRRYLFRKSICKECTSKYELKRRRKNRPEIRCVVCNSPIRAKSTKRMYCSAKCSAKANYKPRGVYKKSCAICEKEFETNNPRKIYCSKSCYIRSFRPHIVKSCEWCGKETTRKRYCSPSCWHEARRAKQRVREAQRDNRIAHLPKNFTLADWRQALDYFGGKCAYCGTKLDKAEQEHFIPVKLGGGYTKDNIVPSCHKCNNKKRAKHPLDWLVTQAKGLVAYMRIMQYFGEAGR